VPPQARAARLDRLRCQLRFGSLRLFLHLHSFRGAGASPSRTDPRAGRLGGFDLLPYIIPPMSPMPPAMPAPALSGGSATIASVMRMFFAIDAAFCSAERVTIVGR
jgi:hypothetical protein